MPQVLKGIAIPGLGEKQSGKVRDFYILPDKRVIVTTDRQSAFDVNLGYIPFKGAVLNQLAAFWFHKTKHIIPSHIIATPDPNVTIAKNCTPIPVEMVVRGYMTGVTVTAIWPSYARGERTIYGIKFPDGLKKNDRLPKPVITPTTHGGGKGGHDDRLTREEIIKQKFVSEKVYQQMEKTALALFEFGTKLCAKQGLILVDTKYEFGLIDGELVIMDEMHTPDSSRFWKAATYKERIKKGLEPENFDKEFLRLWYRKQGYMGDGIPPKMSEQLIVDLSQRYIAVYETITGEKFASFSYPIEERIKKNVLQYLQPQKEKITYEQAGVTYGVLDPIKKLAQDAAAQTAPYLKKQSFSEISETRGESAFVWKQGNVLMASVIEGLGTKNLVADGMAEITKKTYYDTIGHDTVATIINDLVTVGAVPLVLHAYWAFGDTAFLSNKKRMTDLITGWKNACEIAQVTWGGGETPTLKHIVEASTVDLGGSAIGIIKNKKHLLTDKKLKAGDRILSIKSNGVNANGISLTRAIAKKLPKGYATKLTDGTYFGEALLTKSNIYAKLVQDLLSAGLDIHYISNITGHGMRKVMRARQAFRYVIENVFEPLEVFNFIQETAGLSDEEMYGTYNMGQDYAIFLSQKDVKIAQRIVKKNDFESIDAGYIEKGKREVIIQSKNIIFKSETLDLR